MIEESGTENLSPDPPKCMVSLVAEGKAPVICAGFGHGVGFLSFPVMDFS